VQPAGCVALPNVGREGHTYLHHIVNNYENLADWTVFSQAGAPSAGYKGHRLGGGHLVHGMSFDDYVLRQKERDGASFIFSTAVDFDTLAHSMRSNYAHKPEHFSADADMCPSKANAESWEPFFDLGWFRDFLASKCAIDPSDVEAKFADYWTQHVQRPKPASGVLFFAQGARFAASRERIQQRPKEYYEHLLELVSEDSDPCANYFNEWVWQYTIGNVNDESLCEEVPEMSGELRALQGNCDDPVSGAAPCTTLPPTTPEPETPTADTPTSGAFALSPLPLAKLLAGVLAARLAL